MVVERRALDAIVVGAGPAGVSCAVWLARLGLAPALVEASAQVGGLCRQNPYADEWNVSLPGMTGEQIADNLAVSLAQASVPVWLSQPVQRAHPGEDGMAVTLGAAPTQLRAPYLVLATGVRARSLPGLDPAQEGPRILIGPGKHVMEHDFHHLRVAVLGGGDNAFENALYASERGARSVCIFARNVRAQRQFVRKVPTQQVVEGVYRVDARRNTVNGREFDLIMVFYGWEPCTDFTRELGLQRSVNGFVATDPATTQTSHDRVYAIGEVAQRQHPCVVTAMADGVVAAKAIQTRIEAGR